MAFIEELKSGNGTVYAQWSGLLSMLFLLIGGLLNLFSYGFIYAVIGLVELFIMLLLELPIFQKCCPHGESMQKFVKFFEGNWLRAGLYSVFAIIMWISFTNAFSLLIIAALFLTFTAFFYGIAGFKKQDRQQTVLTGVNARTATLLV